MKSFFALAILAVAIASVQATQLSKDEITCLAHTTPELVQIAGIYPNTMELKKQLEVAAETDGEMGSIDSIVKLPSTIVNDCYKMTLMYNAALLYTVCDSGKTAMDVQKKFWDSGDEVQAKIFNDHPQLYDQLYAASYCDHYIQHKSPKVSAM